MALSRSFFSLLSKHIGQLSNEQRGKYISYLNKVNAKELDFTKLPMDSADLLKLIPVITAPGSQLESLNLSDLPVAKALPSLIERLHSLPVKSITLNHSDIDDMSAIEVAKKLLNNKTLKHLELTRNGLTDSSAEVLADLVDKNNVLETLILDENDFTEKGFTNFAKVLKNKSSGLKTLSLDRHFVGSVVITNFLKQLAGNTSLTALDIGANRTPPDEDKDEEYVSNTIPTLETTTALMDVLKANPNLKRLNIWDLDFTNETIAGLAHANLQHLNVSGSRIDAKGLAHLLSNPFLESLVATGSYLREYKGTGIASNSKLTKLWLGEQSDASLTSIFKSGLLLKELSVVCDNYGSPLHAFQHAPALESLKASIVTLEGNVIEDIADIKSLKKLELTGSLRDFSMARVKAIHFAKLAEHPNLKELSLYSDLDIATCQLLGKLPLQKLKIDARDFSIEALRHLLQNTELQELNLQVSTLNGVANAFEVIAQHPTLKSLTFHVGYSKIDMNDLVTLVNRAPLLSKLNIQLDDIAKFNADDYINLLIDLEGRNVHKSQVNFNQK